MEKVNSPQNLTPESNLQTPETSANLTAQEISDFKKLPKAEQEKEKQAKLAKLLDLQNKADQAMSEAIKSGDLGKVKEIKAHLDKEMQDLEQQVNATEILKSNISFEVIPDPEITSAETAIAKLEQEGHKIGDYAKEMLTKVDWQEKLKSSYEVVSFSVSDLFNDKNLHSFGDIKIKAQELGLDLIPQALAPSIRLNYPKDGDWTVMALKESITDRGGYLRLFNCNRNGSESWLNNNNGNDDNKWNDNNRFFFVRK